MRRRSELVFDICNEENFENDNNFNDSQSQDALVESKWIENEGVMWLHDNVKNVNIDDSNKLQKEKVEF